MGVGEGGLWHWCNCTKRAEAECRCLQRSCIFCQAFRSSFSFELINSQVYTRSSAVCGGSHSKSVALCLIKVPKYLNLKKRPTKKSVQQNKSTFFSPQIIAQKSETKYLLLKNVFHSKKLLLQNSVSLPPLKRLFIHFYTKREIQRQR